MRIDLTAPETWEELTREQLLAVAETLCLHLQREEMLVTLFCQLTDSKLVHTKGGWWLRHDGKGAPISIDEISDLSSRFAWIIDTEPDRLANPTPMDDYLRDMTFGDWFEADTHFRLYEKDGDPGHFSVILPLLKEQARELSEAEAKACLWWWNTVQKQLAAAYPNVLERKADPDGEEAAEEEPQYDPFRQLQSFHLLLNDDRPQENDRIDNTRLHDVLSALDNKILKMKLQQEELEKLKRR